MTFSVFIRHLHVNKALGKHMIEEKAWWGMLSEEKGAEGLFRASLRGTP